MKQSTPIFLSVHSFFFFLSLAWTRVEHLIFGIYLAPLLLVINHFLLYFRFSQPQYEFPLRKILLISCVDRSQYLYEGFFHEVSTFQTEDNPTSLLVCFLIFKLPAHHLSTWESKMFACVGVLSFNTFRGFHHQRQNDIAFGFPG